MSTFASTKVMNAVLDGKPRTHSYGFAQLYFNETTRLHLFDQSICERACIPEQVAVPHNHRYDFSSHTLAGIIIDQPVQIVPSIEMSYLDDLVGTDTWTVHELRPSHEGIPECRDTGRGVYVVNKQPRIIRAGDGYFMPSTDYHTTGHVGNTVTLFKRHNIADHWNSVVVPPGFAPQHSLTKQPDVNWLKQQFVNAVLDLPEAAHELIVKEAGL